MCVLEYIECVCAWFQDADEVPDVEWWDSVFLSTNGYALKSYVYITLYNMHS